MNMNCAMTAGAPATLDRLRQAVAKIEGQETDLGVGAPALAFGVSSLDAVLQGGVEGGLAAASLHEIAPAAPCDFGAAAGFTFALAARATGEGRAALWIQTDFAAVESGSIYGPGCDLFGLPSQQLLILKVRHPRDALWAMEEALKSRALASVIVELPNDGSAADLTATRRLTIAAREGGGFGFLFRHRSSSLSSSADTRWEVAAAPSQPDQFGGLGRAAFALSLIKNRRGPTGRWSVTWDHHERAFAPLSVGLAEAALDRPVRTPLRRAG
jgi:protein ImuA